MLVAHLPLITTKDHTMIKPQPHWKRWNKFALCDCGNWVDGWETFSERHRKYYSEITAGDMTDYGVAYAIGTCPICGTTIVRRYDHDDEYPLPINLPKPKIKSARPNPYPPIL